MKPTPRCTGRDELLRLRAVAHAAVHSDPYGNYLRELHDTMPPETLLAAIDALIALELVK